MICYIDAFSGLAGDMLVAALADAGAGRDAITRSLKSLATEAEFAWENVQPPRYGGEQISREDRENLSAHRHLSDIVKLINAADLPNAVKSAAARDLPNLGEAEAHAHRLSIEKVHFHEVGAVDSICDIVGACLGLRSAGRRGNLLLADQRRQRHREDRARRASRPCPATARLLEGKPIYSRGPAMELTTPTGAAIAATLADQLRRDAADEDRAASATAPATTISPSRPTSSAS